MQPQPRPKSKRQQKQKENKKSKTKGKAKASPQQELSETESESNADDDDYQEGQDEEQDELDEISNNAAFEVPLNTLIECLNIFGTAGPATGVIGSSSNERSGAGGGGGRGRGRGGAGGGQGRGWRRGDNNGSDEEDGGRPRGLDIYFGAGASEKRTGMRLSYSGGGYPLTLIMCVLPLLLFQNGFF